MYLLVPSTEQVTMTLSGSSTMAYTCAGLVQSRAVNCFSMAGVIWARSLAVPLAASVAGAVGAGAGAVGVGAGALVAVAVGVAFVDAAGLAGVVALAGAAALAGAVADGLGVAAAGARSASG